MMMLAHHTAAGRPMAAFRQCPEAAILTTVTPLQEGVAVVERYSPFAEARCCPGPVEGHREGTVTVVAGDWVV